jgi:two-component system cell cycle sensor histidine kinase/response regulator CckA
MLLLAAEVSTWFIHLPAELWVIRLLRLVFILFLTIGLFSTILKKELLLLSGQSERRVAEEQLQAQTAANGFLADLIRNSSQPLAVGAPDGRVMLANPAFERLTGYSAEELRSIDWETALTPPEWRELEREKLAEIHRTGRPARYEKEYIRKDGTRVPIELLTHEVTDAAGNPQHYYAFVTDMTDKKRSQEELRRSLERLEKVLDVQTVGVMFWDLTTGCMIDANETFLRMMGYSRSQVEAQELTWQKLTPPEYIAISRAEVEKFMATGRVGPYEKEYFREDGTRLWLLFAGSSLGNNQCVEFCVDISDRKKAESELRSVITNASVGIYRTTVADGGRFVFVNPAMLKMLGYSATEAMELNLERDVYLNPGERAELISSLRKAADFVVMEQAWRKKNGKELKIRSSGRLLRDETAEEFIESFAEDVTEERSIERQFHQAQKMEAVGRLAGGIAHDFNNILGVIVGYSELALDKVRESRELTEYIGQIKGAATRSANLTKQLLMFSRRSTVSLKIVDMNAVVNGLMKLLERAIGEDVSIKFRPGDAIATVQVDVGQMEQVLLNLVVNARDAMPEGGTIAIETKNVVLDENYRAGDESVIPGSYVMLSVSDTGCGMTKEIMSKIFEPFFTTKEVGKGTGLGLATVYGIVKRMNGHVWVYSEVGQGATFKIFLPAGLSPAEDSVESARPVSVGGTETVMVVEDDPDLLRLATNMLKSRGYAVVPANGIEQALELEKRHRGAIHVLLTDVIMPRGNGAELALRMRLLRPDIGTVFMSGYTGDVIAKQMGLVPNAGFVEKPFSLDSLLEAIQSVLRPT